MIISIDQLSKRYNKGLKTQINAVDKLSLEIRSGEVFGFLGPNGAGKSTVIKILMNFIPPTSGTAKIKNIPVRDPASRQSIGYLPENPYFYEHLTAEELLTFGGKAALLETILIRYRIDQLLLRLNLTHVKHQQLRTYSKGMVQRIGLALALVHDPELFILDEPMSGLDPIGRRLVADLILEMRSNGKTVFFSSHILSDIEKLCDRVGILNRGRLLYCGPVEDLFSTSGGLEEAFIKIVENDERENYETNLVAG